MCISTRIHSHGSRSPQSSWRLILLFLCLVPETFRAAAQDCDLYPIALCQQTLNGAASGQIVTNILNGIQPGNFGWLSWAGSPSEQILVTSLIPPGDHATYVNPDNRDDRQISLGDWVSGKPGVSNSKNIQNALDALKQSVLTVPIWNQARGQGEKTAYQVAGFARVRLLSYELPGQNRISVEFLGFVTCGEQNFPPRIDAGPDQTILLNETVALNGSATDDGLPALGSLVVNWSKISGPGNANFSQTNTPATSVSFDQAGTYLLRLTAFDGELTSSDDVTVTVDLPNHPPQATAQQLQTNEDQPLPITLAGADQEGDLLTFRVVSPPQHGSLSGTSPNLVFTPTPDFNGADSFTFVANDGLLDSAPATISITINPVNDPPLADPQTVSTDEDTPLEIQLTGSDLEGDSLTFIITAPPGHGTLSGTAPNLTYTPALNFNGSDQFSFVAHDGTTNSAPATIAITIHPVNDPPKADSQAVIVDEDTSINITLTGSDVEGDGITFSVVTPPSHGSLSGTPPNLIYRPDPNYFGPDGFTFKANDGLLDSALGSVFITVNPVNDAPIVNAGADQEITLPAQATLNGVVTDDGTPAGKPLSISWVKVSGPGIVIFNPGANPSSTARFSAPGPYVLRLIASDSELLASDDVTVNVLPGVGNQAPFVSAGQDQVIGLTDTATLSGLVTDDGLPVGSTLAVSWTQVNGPAQATFSNPQAAITSAQFPADGAYVLRLSATDGDLASIDEVMISVYRQNQPPVVNAGPDQNIVLPNMTTPVVAPVSAATRAVPDTWQYEVAQPGVNYYVRKLAARGRQIFAGGNFSQAGGQPSGSIAAWDGCGSWVPLNDPNYPGFETPTSTTALEANDNFIFGGGGFFIDFGHEGQRDWTTEWDLNTGTWNPWVFQVVSPSLSIWDIKASSNSVYVGGQFSFQPTTQQGSITPVPGYPISSSIAGWNGTNWFTLGNGITDSRRTDGQVQGAVFAIAAGPEGSVYAGGSFVMQTANGIANHIARWDGTNWWALGSGIAGCTGFSCNPVIDALEFGPDGNLYAAGNFTQAGGVAASCIAKWNGTQWSPVGGGVSGEVFALATRGADLYVGGNFGQAGGSPASQVAKWTGQHWESLGTGATNGVNGTVFDFAVTRSGIYLGGFFTAAGGRPANYVVKWGTSEPPILQCPPDTIVQLDSPSGASATLSAQAFHPCAKAFSISWQVDGGPVIASTEVPAGGVGAVLGFSYTYTPGVHLVTVTADDGVAPPVTCSCTVTVPPAIYASISATVADDGLPAGSSLTHIWSLVSGPGSVQFDDPNASTTRAVFSQIGTYVLRFTANDSQLSGFDELTINVSENQPPLVNAGPDQSTMLSQAVSLAGTASDDGLPAGSTLSVAWSQISGPGTAVFANSGSASTTASFNVPGEYMLRFSASDSQITVADDLIVTVQPDCQSPTSGLAGWWTGDSTIQNSTSHADGVLLNGATYGTGKFGQGFQFDGLDDGVRIAAAPSLDVGTSSGLTVEAWIKPGDLGSRPIVEWQSTSGAFGVHFWSSVYINGVGGNGSLFANLIDTSGNSHYFFSSTGFLVTTNHQHVALTYDKTTGLARLYCNGNVIAAQNLGSFTPQTSYHLYLGYRANNQVFKGNIDELGIYHRALSAMEIQVLATVGNPGKCSAPVNPCRDPVREFSVASNPNGDWSYGLEATLGSSFIRFGSGTSDANIAAWQPTGTFLSSFPVVAYNKSGTILKINGVIPFAPDLLFMHPSTKGEYSVVRWTAPASGLYRISGFFEGLDTTTSDVHVQLNALDLFSGPINGRGNFRFFNVARQLGIGDHIDFAVGWGNGNAANDSTGLHACIEPLSELTANSSPLVQAGPGKAVILPSTLSLTGTASDDALPAGSSLSFQWTETSGPSPVVFSPPTSLATTVQFTTPGVYVLRLTATDSQLATSDELTVRVYPTGTANQAPTVNAGPDLTIAQTQAATLTGTVNDDGLPTTSSLILTWSKVSGPGTVTFDNPNSILTTATFSSTGSYVLRLTANDGQLSASDDIAITVATDSRPLVDPGPSLTINQSQPAALNGVVSDDGLPAGVPLTISWSQVSGPGVVSFNGANSISSDPVSTATFSVPGTYILRLSADDSIFLSTADVTVTVLPPPNQAPIVDAGPDQGFNLPGVLQLDGTVADDGLPARTLIKNWSQVSGPGTVSFSTINGMYYASFSAEGVYVLRLTASDTQLESSDDLTVTVFNMAPEPVVEITSSTDAPEITAPTQVTGTVSSAILTSYQLQLRYQDDTSDWVTFASGTTPVQNGPLGVLDPTLNLNGTYELRLTATDQANRTVASEPITVIFGRNMKVGNFSVAFSDMKVPVAGLNMEIVRAYDSRDKRVGDFGVGWTLAIRNIRLQKNRPFGPNWRETSTGGFFPTYCMEPRKPRTVTITLPDNKTFKFEAKTAPDCQFGVPIDAAHIVYSPTPDTQGDLESVAGDDVSIAGTVPGLVDLFDLATGDLYEPTLFKLTTHDGEVYILDEHDGLKSLTDRNGNTLTVTPEGIFHSSGQSIQFVRDPQGRITKVVDPAGNAVAYNYDASGNLVSFADRENSTTLFSFDDTHRLLTITDPRGIQPLRNEYDAAGRLVRQIDGQGNVLEFTHDLGNRLEIIRDRLGNPTVHEYDQNGNIVRTVDALGNPATFTYDANDNQVTKTDALGNTTRDTYDARDNKLTETDPLGNVTQFSYNDYNQVLTQTDPLGNVTLYTYDAGGNLTDEKDALGNITHYTYDETGNILSRKDALGNVTSFSYAHFTYLTNTVTQDANGAVLSSTAYNYDTNGNQVQKTVTRTPRSGLESLVTLYAYDKENRLTQTTFPDGSTAQTVYNPIGKPAIQIDPLGRQTLFDYDTQGNLAKTTYPDGTSEITGYDAQNRKISFQDREGRINTYTNDALGQLLVTTFPDGAHNNSTYDAIGRVASVTDARGNTTHFAYDICECSARKTTIIDPLGNVTRFTYDGNGNQTSMIDALGRTNLFRYDALNRQVQTVFPDGTTRTTYFDSLGRHIAETDQAGISAWFGYDALSRLTSVTNALGGVTRYAYDELGDLVNQTDANGHVTTFEYDAMGRRTRRTLPLGQFETYQYDLAGNVSSKTDFNGFTTTYQYDSNNRLLAKTPDSRLLGSGSVPLTFSYTPTGQRASMSDASGTTAYQYDNRDRLLQKATPEGTLFYAYDAQGNVTAIRSGNVNGASVTYDYDALNRLAAVNDPMLGRTIYGYDAVGNLQGYTYPNGVNTAVQYDSLNRLTNMVSGTVSAPLASYAYVLGPAGHRLNVSELGGRRVDYAYDPLYRLTGETVTGAPVSGGVTYTYDSVGNRLTRGSSLAGVSTAAYGYDANDRLSSDIYDANGNTVAGSVLDAQTGQEIRVSDAYDFENHLISRNNGQVQIVYDGDGNRVQETSNGQTTLFLVDDRNPTGYAQVLEEHWRPTTVTRHLIS